MATPFDGDKAPTAAQREAILRQGHLLIAAGAGSGKTTTLVDKIVHALGAERFPGETVKTSCELSQIAAITFTNAAAADLKRKLRDRLSVVADWYAAAGNREAERQWRGRVYEVDRARIGTIHSFCGDLLRDYALRLGIDPAFTVIDEGEAGTLRAECVRAVLERELERGTSIMGLVDEVGLGGLESLIGKMASRGPVIGECLEKWGDSAGRSADPGVVLAAEALRLTEAVREEMAVRLGAAGALDFDGLVSRTADALDNEPAVLGAVRRGLHWLFVDEFQDTDSSQVEIAYRITGFGEAGTAGGPSLCIVGDPKQSIYRFRRADVSIWARVQSDFENAGLPVIHLDTNFRSREPIIAYVNTTFGSLMAQEAEVVAEAGHAVPYVPLVAHRKGAVESCVELLVSSDADADEKAEARRLAEANAVAARLIEMVNGSASAGEKIHWGDAAVLVRSRAPIDALESVFRARGIPYYIAGGSGFFGRREVRDVRLLLTALIDPLDDLAWLGVFRSPWVGVKDETLLCWRIGNERREFSALLADETFRREADALARARNRIGALRAMRDRVPLGQLIDHALHRSGYAGQLLTRAGGRNALMNLRKLVHIADARPDDSVADFLAFMTEREETTREGDAVLFTAGEDVVTITTVHSAKGLEWPVVFLVDLEREIKKKCQTTLIADPAAGIALKVATGEHDEKDEPSVFDDLKERELALSRAEEKRLWYVAATRAKDRLVLCARASDVGEAASCAEQSEAAPKEVRHWLLGSMSMSDAKVGYSDGNVRHLVVERTPAPLPAVDGLPPALADDASIAAASANVEERMLARCRPVPPAAPAARRSATELMALADDRESYRNRYVLGLPDRRVFGRGGSGTRAGLPANVLGDVLHGALETAREDAELLEYLEHQLVERLGESAGSARVSQAVARLRSFVEASRNNPDVARMYDTPNAARELEFTWFARGTHGVTTMHGAMDLVAAPDGQSEILDYKSHEVARGSEPAVAAKYQVQADVYATALRSITANTPASFTFFFPATNRAVTHALDADGLDLAAARVAALLDDAHKLAAELP